MSSRSQVSCSLVVNGCGSVSEQKSRQEKLLFSSSDRFTTHFEREIMSVWSASQLLGRKRRQRAVVQTAAAAATVSD